MAGNENVGLLGEIIGQLKQLNKASSTDMLREAEALKRQEKLQKVTEQQTDFSGAMVDDQKDFTRRFISAQASQLVNEQQRLAPRAKKSLDLARGAKGDRETDLEMQSSQSLALQKIGSVIYMNHDHLKAISNKLSYGHLKLIKLATETTAKVLSDEQGPKSLMVHDQTVMGGIGKVLSFDEKRADELDKQRNSDNRSAEEARREQRKALARRAGGAGVGGLGEEFGEEGEGGIWDTVKSHGTTGLSAILLTKIFAIGRWMGFGKGGVGFKAAMGAKFTALGAKIFPGKKLTGNQKKMARNPRMWPTLLAILVAQSFLTAADESLSETDGGDGPVGSDGANFEGNEGSDEGWITPMNVLSTALWTTMLTPAKLKLRIKTGVNARLLNVFKKAGGNTLRGRMFANPKFAKLLGRGALRMMGPWGLAAWAVWTIVDYEMKRNEQVMLAHEQTLADIEKALESEEGFYEFLENDPDAERFFFDDSPIPMDFNKSGAKRRALEQKEQVKSLFLNKSEKDKDFIKKALIEFGNWDSKAIDNILTEMNLDATKASWANRFIEAPTKMKNKKQWKIDNNPGYQAFLDSQAAEEAIAERGGAIGMDRGGGTIIGTIDMPNTNTHIVTNVYVEDMSSSGAAVASIGGFSDRFAHLRK